MPEIKHNFTGGKMNKDLDERLVPNGEYRDAMNIQVSTSEGSDVGTVQNILGNILIPGQNFIPENSTCVGSIADERNDKLYYFITQKKFLNLDFTGDNQAGWNLNSGWNLDNNRLEASAAGLSGDNARYSSLETDSLTAGESYKVTFTISNYTAGEVRLILYSQDNKVGSSPNFSGNGTFTAIITINPNNISALSSAILFQPRQLAFTGDIDNISIINIKDFILEYNSVNNSITPVLVDTTGGALKFNENNLITGVNIIDDMIFWTDNESEPKKINISRCIEGTYPDGLTHTKLINKSRDIDINSNIDLQEEHITVIRKSPKTAPTIELLSGQGQDANSTYGGIMRITPDPGGLTAGGSNPQNSSSFINASNQYYDFSQFSIGSQFSTRIETDLQGDSGFTLGWVTNDTVVLKEFGGVSYDEVPPSPITNYSIKARVVDVINPSDDVTEVAPNGDFTLPNSNGTKPLGYGWSSFNTNANNITYDSINSKVIVDTLADYQIVASATPSTSFATGTAAQAGTYRITYEIQGIVAGSKAYVVIVSSSSGSNPTYWTTPTVTSNGTHTYDLTLENSLGGNFSNFSYAAGKFFVRTASWGGAGPVAHEFELLNISIERLDVTDAQVELEITGFEGTPPATPPNYAELKYAVEKLNEEEKLFEYKFPRFAYRYQYEDKEYSTFSPFTQVAFLPGSFDYHPRNAYNLGMVNNVNEIKLSRFIPTAIEGQDIVAVDILYKDEASSNVYVVDTIKNNQDNSNIWINDEYIVKSEIIKRVLPSNQLLRPWDAVPKTALAQEVSGNRVVYANYTQGFDLVNEVTDKEYYPNLSVGLSSDYQGLSTVRSIKSLREYQLGVVFVDKYGRETPVLSNSTGDKKIPKKDSNKSNKLEVSFIDTMFPKDLKYFKFFIKETSGEYYNMSMDRWWDAGDGLAWLSFPSSDINKVDIDTFLILKKGVGSNDLVEDKARYKVLAIETEAPDHVKTNKLLLEEKTQIFTSTDESLFGNTTNNAPLIGRDSFQINYAPFQDSSGSELHNVEDGTLYIEFAIGEGTSDRYRITEISQPAAPIGQAKYNIKLDKNLGDDIKFICDDPATGLSPTKIIDNTIVRIYKYVVENTSEFDGRFFVKVNKDEVFTSNVYEESTQSVNYRVSVSKKLYYMGSNQHKLHNDVLTGQTKGIYKSPLHSVGVGSSTSNYNMGGQYNYLHFGHFAPFFRNYKWGADTVQADNGSNIGQYRFDDNNQSDWKDELAYTGATGSAVNYPSHNLKKADHSGFDAGERYGIFNGDGEQEKGNVWFIDGGPYSGERTGSDSLEWEFIHSTNGVEQGVAQGNQSSSMIIAIGGIYHDKENHEQNMQNDSQKTEEFFNIGRDNGNPYYNTSQFKDLVGKISPSIKFRFREDPTDEIYTIQPSGVNHHRRLRWSDGDIMTNAQTGEFPAWTSTDEPQPPQLSPNFSMGYKTKFKNSSETGNISWDPTNGGVTGAIDGGLLLTTTRSQTANDTTGSLPMIKVSVDNIHDLTCDVNGGKHSITKGMILTSYGGVTLNGTFTNPGATKSHEPLIIENITGSGPFNLYLTGYSSPILKDSGGAVASIASGGLAPLKRHIIWDTEPASTDSMVFQQPAMNGYSQYSVNRINVENANGDGSSLSSPALLAVGYTIEFLETFELESEFPSNPAMWETEPKETTDLDIYYEASGYNPLELTEETKNLAIPVKSLAECIENPSATISGMEVVSVDNVPLPSTLSPGQSGTGPWRLSLSTKFQQEYPIVGGNFIQIGSHLKITKPDGSIITVEVTGWDASAGFSSYPTNTAFIYINEVLHGPNTKYTLGWHNCYSFGNGVESNRIRDTFNLPFITNGVKASTTLDENPYEEQLKYGLIYSGIYNSNSSINNLNQFIAAEKITKDINPTYGSIQKLKAGWGQGGDLITLCEDRVLKILANKDALFNADGNTNLTSTNNVLGQAVPYSGEYGISTNPESFASEAYRAYFTDKVRGTVMRLSMDGLTPISSAGMGDFFKDNLKLSNKLIGSYDDKKDEYNITLTDRKTLGEELITNGNFKDEVLENVLAAAIVSEPGLWFMSSGPHWFWDGVNENMYSDANPHSRVGQYLLTPVTSGKSYEISWTVGKPVTEELEGRLWVTLHDENTNYKTISNSGKTSAGSYVKTVTVDDSWSAWQFPANSLANSINFHNKEVSTGDGVFFNGTVDNISVKEITIDPKTVSYKENTKGWVSFKSFIPENALSTASNYYTVFGGKLYKHHVESADRNTFYNTFTNSSVNVLLNDIPSTIKSYRTLEYEGSQSRVVQNLEDNEYYNLTDKDGWFVSSIETNKKKGSLLEFIEKEGKWFNYIKGLESSINDINFGSFEVQGLGIQSEMVLENANGFDDGTVRIFIDGGINCSLQVGDAVYYQLPDSEKIFSAGVVVTNPSFFDGITGPTQDLFQVDMNDALSGGPGPANGAYWMFIKNQVINMSKLSGYYANAKFENDSKVKAELYAVSSEITESSK